MTKREQIIEVMARAAIATRFGSEGLLMFEPIPEEFDPTGERTKLIKHRCDESRNEAEAALTALESSGYMVRPVEATEGMIDKGWRKFDAFAKPQNRCCNMDRAMSQHWLKEMRGE